MTSPPEMNRAARRRILNRRKKLLSRIDRLGGPEDRPRRYFYISASLPDPRGVITWQVSPKYNMIIREYGVGKEVADQMAQGILENLPKKTDDPIFADYQDMMKLPWGSFMAWLLRLLFGVK